MKERLPQRLAVTWSGSSRKKLIFVVQLTERVLRTHDKIQCFIPIGLAGYVGGHGAEPADRNSGV